jgi:hypothetical protein
VKEIKKQRKLPSSREVCRREIAMRGKKEEKEHKLPLSLSTDTY